MLALRTYNNAWPSLKTRPNLPIRIHNIHLVTPQLARQFMPRLKEVTSRKDTYTLSLQNYNHFDYKTFNPDEGFEKWIGVEVTDLDIVPKSEHSTTILNEGDRVEIVHAIGGG